ncbi:MAG: ABC transporter ATP-binding protein [Verrucomicrobiales bacterium]|nr:ABC transporter ATP-binding protein [Verrucomicrobiales bacterium]HQZ29893.1 ABC transporter ATP-binding protein [Verrucomicrobiales bacterium]
MNVLQVSRVKKSYGPAPVLRGVSFSLEAGERAALMGPSGSGKSTLLNCIGGIDRPDEGAIAIGGQSLEGLDEIGLCRLRRETVSTVFQFFHLLPTLSAYENVEFPMQLNGVSAADRAERVRDLIEEVGLSQRSAAMPHELSGGEMQRVAIARALAIRPRIILADEPTGNLDSKTGETILDLLERLSERHGIAMLLVTHSPQVTRICQRIFEMKDGFIIGQDSIS